MLKKIMMYLNAVILKHKMIVMSGNYQLYYNLICSFCFLPLIIQPTRVVDIQTPSLIDNIFCNNLSDEIIGGNIYLTLSL